MKKTVRLFVWIFAAGLLAVAVGFIISLNSRLSRYRQAYEIGYRRAFSELVGSVANIDADLSKGVYVQSPSMLVTLSTDIYRHAEAAKSALSVLPTSDVSLARTSNFISQAGDFSVALARSAAGGNQITADDRKNLRMLSDTAAQISAELEELYAVSDASGFFDVSDAEALDAEQNRTSFAGGMSTLESNLPESPVLIYDGPYSSHITQTVPQYLQAGGKTVDANQARTAAARFLGAAPDSLSLHAQTQDPVVYTFAGSDDSFISVTGVGGHVISYTQNVVPSGAACQAAQATKTAATFLAARGYPDMVASYAYTTNGICYINFTYSDHNVLVYPDLIQVGVSADTGKVTYFQAVGYLNNHRDGRPLTASLSQADARAKLLPSFTPADDGRLCIIPSPGKNEILCYEFKGTGENGKQYLCYLNANTGVEESIFLLLEDENGVLTI